tara:strand:+ start:169 stop:471 length:303 start_codon:yes stop_codon:yes gene_type:complete
MQQIPHHEALPIFDGLKHGQVIRLTVASSIHSAATIDVKVGRRSRSKKYNVETIPLINLRNPNGLRYFLYKRNASFPEAQQVVALAHGDMAATLVDIETD